MPEPIEAGPIASRGHALLTFCATSAALGLLVLALLLVLPADPPPSREVVRSFLDFRGTVGGDGVHPEPREHAIFLAFALAAPLIALVACERLRGRGTPRALTSLAALLGALASAFVASVVLPPLWTIVGAQEAGDLALITLVAAGSYAAARTLRAARLRVLGSAAVLATCALALVAMKHHSIDLLVDWGPDELHLQSFVFSAAQSAAGKHCLVDYVPLYGCYGELLAPFLRAMGSTLDALAVCMIACSLIALGAIAWFLRRTVSRPVLASSAMAAFIALWLVRGTRVPLDIRDNYYQYIPLRFVFPAIALLVGLAYRRPSWKLSTAYGALGAVATCWNPDSGVAATGSLLALVGFDLLPWLRRALRLSPGPRLPLPEERRALACLAAFAAAFGAVLAAFLAATYAGSGIPPSLAPLFYYSRLYFVTGWFMIPMSLEPSCYPLVLAVYVGLIVRAVTPAAPEHDHGARPALQLAVLGIGLFAYYVGRSHPNVLTAVVWPSLIGGALLLDAAMRPFALRSGSIPHAALCALLAALTSLTGLLAYQRLTWTVPHALRAMPEIGREVAFVERTSKSVTPLAMLAVQQGVLLLHARRGQSLKSPALAELVARSDMERMIAQLGSGAVDLVYLDRDLEAVRPFILDPLRPTLARHFERVSTSPGGRLTLLRHRR